MKKLNIFNQFLYLLNIISIYYIYFYILFNLYCNNLGIRNKHTSSRPANLVNKTCKIDKDLSFN